MLELRPYQSDLIVRTREALAKYRRVILQAPTGAGKTAMTVSMIASAVQKGNRAMFCVHQKELLTQTSAAIWKQKIEHGLIASGKGRSPLPVQLASVQTLVNRLDHYQEPQLIIIDEAHRAAANSYLKVIKAYPNAFVIGLTATPKRTDKQSLKVLFNHIVQGPQISELMIQGYLCDYVLLAPPQVADTSKLSTRAGDYAVEEAEEAVDKGVVTGDAVAHYKKHAYGKRCVVMCVSIKHAMHVTEAYNEAGIPSAFLSGDMSEAERSDVLKKFAAGDILVLTNVQLMIEGVDIPAIEVVQWLRPTKSLIVWMQGNGRGLRPMEGKDKLTIFDHVGNCHRHGLPDDEREWTLEDEPAKRKKSSSETDVKIRSCKECFAIFKPTLTACPACGAPVIFLGRQVEVVEGDLAVVTETVKRMEERKERKREQGAARSVRDLVELGMRKGMPNPSAWAANVSAGRDGRKPTSHDFEVAKKIHMGILNERKQFNEGHHASVI